MFFNPALQIHSNTRVQSFVGAFEDVGIEIRHMPTVAPHRFALRGLFLFDIIRDGNSASILDPSVLRTAGSFSFLFNFAQNLLGIRKMPRKRKRVGVMGRC